MDVDARLLRTLTTVLRLGSFSAAARELGYTQSAVSQHVVALETDLGTRLVERRPVQATEAGARLLEHAGPILLRLDAARADVAQLAADPGARMLLGAAPLAATTAMLAAVGGHARAHAVREFTVRVLGSAEVAESVAVGDLDVGLVCGVAVRSDPLRLPAISSLRSVATHEEEVVAAVPADHPLADRAEVHLTDLTDALWVDAPAALGPLAEVCATAGIPPVRVSVHYDGTDLRTLCALLAAGEGLALLPRSALTPDLVGVHLSRPDFVHRVEVVHNRVTTTAVESLVADLTAR